jgi:hypothetical protein
MKTDLSDERGGGEVRLKIGQLARVVRRRQRVEAKRETHLGPLPNMGQAGPKVTRQIRHGDREHALSLGLLRDAASVTVAIQVAMAVEHVQRATPAAC